MDGKQSYPVAVSMISIQIFNTISQYKLPQIHNELANSRAREGKIKTFLGILQCQNVWKYISTNSYSNKLIFKK
jgi:hypothetical protein